MKGFEQFKVETNVAFYSKPILLVDGMALVIGFEGVEGYVYWDKVVSRQVLGFCKQGTRVVVVRKPNFCKSRKEFLGTFCVNLRCAGGWRNPVYAQVDAMTGGEQLDLCIRLFGETYSSLPDEVEKSDVECWPESRHGGHFE